MGAHSIEGRDMGSTIRKAVIPVAGLGSRLLPLTKAIPKEMLPVGDNPVIQHTIEELVSSGITTSPSSSPPEKRLCRTTSARSRSCGRLRDGRRGRLADAFKEIAVLARRATSPTSTRTGPCGNGTRCSTRRAALAASRSWCSGRTTCSSTRCPGPAADPRLRGHAAARPGPDADGTGGSQRYGVPIVREDLGGGLLRSPAWWRSPSPPTRPRRTPRSAATRHPGIVDELREQTKRWYEHRTGEIYLTDAINACAAGPSYTAGHPGPGTTPATQRTTSSPRSPPPWRTPSTGRCCAGWPNATGDHPSVNVTTESGPADSYGRRNISDLEVASCLVDIRFRALFVGGSSIACAEGRRSATQPARWACRTTRGGSGGATLGR